MRHAETTIDWQWVGEIFLSQAIKNAPLPWTVDMDWSDTVCGSNHKLVAVVPHGTGGKLIEVAEQYVASKRPRKSN